MAKKYTDNYKLNIAVRILLSSLEGYKTFPIHDVISLESGDGLPKHQMINGSYPVYGGGGKTANNHNSYNIDFETIGIGRVGARCGCVFTIEKKSWVTDNALYAKKIDDRFSLKFLKHFLSYSKLNQYANVAMQPVISKTGIQSVKIPLLPIEKQIEIGEFIDDLENNIFDKIDNFPVIKSKFDLINRIDSLEIENKIQSNLLIQIHKSILKEAIQGRLTKEWRNQNLNVEPASVLLKRIKAEIQRLVKEKKLKKEKELEPISDSEIPFELPKSWLWCRLGNIVQHNAGKTLHKGNNTGILKDYLTTSNVYWGFFKLDNVKQIQIEPKEYERCTASKGDLLICEGGDVGRSAIWNEDYEICIQNHIHRVRPFCQVNSKYIYYYMNYLHSNNLILDYKKGMGIGNLSGTALASIKLTLPPLEEQQAIVEKVDMLMNKCLKLSQEIETLEKQGITLMKAMFNETFETKTEVAE